MPVSMTRQAQQNQSSVAQTAADRPAAELRAVIESMSDAVYIGGMDGITFANQAALDQLGFTSCEELNRNIGILAEEIQTRDWATGAPIPVERQAFARALRGERVVQDVLVRHRLTGEERVVRCSAAPVLINGQVTAAVAVNSDVTEHRSAEAALNKSERYFRAFVSATSDVIYRMNPDWSVMYQLRGSGFLFDTDSPDSNWIERYIHPEDRPRVLAATRQAVAGKTIFQLEHRVIRADGTPGWTASRAIPMFDAGGEITEWFGTATDITMRRNAEEALLKSEKLAVVGRLASSIAHEINNPLEAVTNLIYLASQTNLPPDAGEYLRQADAELRRVSQIASETLRFHRQSTHASGTVLSDVVASVLSLHQHRIRNEGISVDLRYRQTAPITAWPDELRQVIANLVTNAIDAMASSRQRQLRIRTRQGHNPQSGQPGVWLTVADTGAGMSAAIRYQIFDPFFTTRAHIGTGLGLWVSQQIVQKHGGRILVRSRQHPSGSGTVFLLFFPTAGVPPRT